MGAPKGNKNAVGNNGGRPTDYRPEYADMAYRLTLLGLTDEELAHVFEVNEDTIYEWKKKHIEFSDSIKRGKDIADSEVVESLFRRAKGYEYREVHYEKIEIKEGDVDEEDIELEAYKKKVIVKEVAPDPTSIKFWLINRQRKNWRDKQEIETNVKTVIIDWTE
jgi:uncharacterized protein YjcR